MRQQSLIGSMRDAGVLMKSISSVVILTFGSLTFSPTVLAAKAELEKPAEAGAEKDQDLSQVYDKLTKKLERFEQLRDDDDLEDDEREAQLSAIKDELDELEDELEGATEQFEEQFAATGDMLKQKKLPKTILKRHEDMVAHYTAHKNMIQTRLDDRNKGSLQWKLERLYDKLKSKLTGKSDRDVVSPIEVADPYKFKRSHQAFDPNNLPNKSMQPDPDNKPKKFKRDFAEAGLFSTPSTMMAALGDFTYDSLAGADDPAYLAESDEVGLTQRVRDKAMELNYDPVTIYHWVRNNVEWQPSWGAVQDAELTLDARRGNAIDIASLTIALLRASQIPARYVHGTIEVPIEEFKNWAGGFTSSLAAAEYAASGGIPSAASVSGGDIATIQMEHVWVEAAIDFFPTRGEKNRDADSWVQMDPSYKQYNYLPGLDTVAISGIDADQLAAEFLASGSVNEIEGWVSGFDPTILESAQSQAQAALENHIANNNIDAAVSDVIGGRKNIIQEFTQLPSSLPNAIIVEGGRYDKIPSALQQRVTYTLGFDNLGQPYQPASFSWSSLNNEKVTLSFRPATPDDEVVLQSILPSEMITDISQLPGSIPSYLIEVVPELKVNGVLKLTGLAMSLGAELPFNTSIAFPNRAIQTNYTYNVPAGSYLSINTVAGYISDLKLQSLENKIENTGHHILNTDVNSIEATREDVLGDIYHAGSMAYFSQYIGLGDVTAKSYNSQFNLAAGYGTYGYEPAVNYIFGIPASIDSGATVLDVLILTVAENNEDNNLQKKGMLFQLGALSSYLENQTPDHVFEEFRGSNESVSSVKNLQLAREAGQQIYLVDASNVGVLDVLEIDADIKSEIISSASAGLITIVHASPISESGYVGTGYIVLDPDTGSAAYKINKGINGALSYSFNEFSNAISLLATGVELRLVFGNISSSLIPAFVTKFIGVAKVMSYINRVHQVLAHCPNDNMENVGNLVALMSITILQAIFTVAASVWLGPIGTFIAGEIFSRATDAAATYLLRSQKGCNF